MSETRAATFYTVPAGTRKSQCSGENCRALIYWITNPRTGRMMPIDCDVDGGEEPGELHDPKQIDAFAQSTIANQDGRGVSHFTTCADADRFTGRNRSNR